MGDNGYPLDLLSPVRHVATELSDDDGARSGALSIEQMAASYQHPNTGDLARVRREQGFAGNAEAEVWLIGQAITELGKQVEPNGGGYRLTRDFEKIRYPGRKHLRRYHDPHVQLRDPFNPQSGQFAENVRRLHKDDPTELRESMQTFGWVEEFPAIKDERGVVLVGHRRLAIADELGIAPVVKIVRLGDGDEADAKRFRLAIASNLGGKPFTPPERKRIAVYLYGEHEWSQQRIAEALAVSQSTVRDDLVGATNSTRRGRPPNLTPEQEQHVIDNYHEFGGAKTMKEVTEDLGLPRNSAGISGTVEKAIDRERGRREERARQQAGLCTCPNCGNTHEVTHGPADGTTAQQGY